MKLYHGSNMEIDKPDLSRSKPFKDFGQGFYLSPGYEQAHALAKQKTDQLQSGEPCVTIFELEDQIIKTSDLQIKIFDDYCEEWAQFVLLNRDRSHTHPAHTYDIVIGPIADDGVTYQLRRYSMGDISMSRLIEELKYGIQNFNYGIFHKPILYGALQLEVVYKDSKKDFGIQMADILANTVRHSFVINNNWFDTSKYLKEKCHFNVLLRLP